MTDPLLSPHDQRIVTLALAALLLVISLFALWLCKQLGRANDRLYRRQREESTAALGRPDHRQVPAQRSPTGPPDVIRLPDSEARAKHVRDGSEAP